MVPRSHRTGGGARERQHTASETNRPTVKRFVRLVEVVGTAYDVQKYEAFSFFGYDFRFIQVQQLIDLVLTCKRNAENEVNREEAARGAAAMTPGRKRRLEQVKAERAIKYLRASQDCSKNSHVPGEKQHPPHLILLPHSESDSLSKT